MSRLLHAGYYRLRKNKLTWACLILTISYCLFIYVTQYHNIRQYGGAVSLDPLFFNFVIYMGILTAVLTSLFIGTEYHDGTIRNKIVCGLSRNSIYLSNLLLCVFTGTILLLVSFLIGLFVGIPLFGTFTMTTPTLLSLCMISLLSTWAYISIFTMVTTLSPSRTTAAILNLLLAFGLLFIGMIILNKLCQPEYIQQVVATPDTDAIITGEAELEWVKNPFYLTGMKREIYQHLLDFLPSGQVMQIFNESATNILRMILYSFSIIIGTNVVGLLLFHKKNIK